MHLVLMFVLMMFFLRFSPPDSDRATHRSMSHGGEEGEREMYVSRGEKVRAVIVVGHQGVSVCARVCSHFTSQLLLSLYSVCVFHRHT